MNNQNKKLTNQEIQDYINALLEKSEEAYLLALEIINKPTIRYRTEGFCFFICNAWELTLKAFIIKRENNINAMNFKNNPNQSLGLIECMERVFTSTTDYVKANLNLIREIRNRGTHSFLPEYDFSFAPIFQRCVSNFVFFFEKHFPEYKLNKQITAFVALSNIPDEQSSTLSLNPKSLLQFKLLDEKIRTDINTDSISQTIRLISTKKSKDADVTFALSDEVDDKAHMIKVPKDVNITHPYSAKQALKKIQEALVLSLGVEHGFNITSFQRICKDRKVFNNQKYFYEVKYATTKAKLYSEELIEYIVYLYSQDGDVRNKYKKRLTPGKTTAQLDN